MRNTIKGLVSLLLAAALMLSGVTSLSADTWSYYLDITVSDNSGVARSNIVVATGIPSGNMVSAGYFDADGLNTRLKSTAGTDLGYTLLSNNVYILIPSLSAYGNETVRLYLKYAPDISAIPVVVGADGYITTADNAALELGDDYEIEISGYIDASAGADKNIISKANAFRLYISGAGALTYSTNIAGDLTLYGTTSDGQLAKSNASYSTARTTATADSVGTGTDIAIGQNNNAINAYSVFRGFLYFDTSALSAGTVTSATLYVYGAADYSDTDFDITIQNGQPTYPSDPLVVGDYLYSRYTGDGGTLSTASFSTAGYNAIALNATGIGWLNAGGATKLTLRSSRDIAGTSPGANTDEFVQIYSSAQAGTDKDPYLVIETDNIELTGAVSTGEHTIKVVSNGTTVKLYDGATELDSDSASTIGDTASAIITQENNAMPIMRHVYLTVNDARVLAYQAGALIVGTALPDLEGTVNGVITFDLAANVDVVIGELTPYANPVPVVSGDNAPPEFVQDITQPAGWYGSGTGAGLPFYSTFNAAATGLGMTTQTLYLWFMLALAAAVGLVIVMFTQSTLMAAVGCGGVIVAGVGAGILSAWMLLIFAILAIGVVYLARRA